VESSKCSPSPTNPRTVGVDIFIHVGVVALGIRAQALSTGEKAMDKLVHIEQDITVAAPREKVFEALTTDVNSWWAFRVAGADTTIHLEREIGGWFYEEAGDGRGALWDIVTGLNQPSMMRLTGPLGVTTPTTGVFQFDLEEASDSTVLKLSHKATGDLYPKFEEEYTDG